MQIKINNLSHTYAPGTRMEYTAVKFANLNIKQGEFVGIIGQTGCGKSTLIEHLNALLLPSTGSITWDFENKSFDRKSKTWYKYQDRIQLRASWYTQRNHSDGTKTVKLHTKRLKKVRRSKDIRSRVAIAFQFAEYQLFEETIEKDIMFGPMSFGVDKKEAKQRAKKYLNLCGLDDSFLHKSPFGLSGGQKRRVALAGILAIEPDVIVADEPTAGLDPVGVQEILSIFTKLHKMGKTVVIVTHDLDNILQVSERVVMMHGGTIVKDGPTYDVLKDTKFLKQHNLEAPRLLEFVSELENKGIKVPPTKSLDELAAFLSEYIAKKGVK
ncbi:cobalt import ATP-binding protein [Mycoplasmopsis californica HAZ160_1]|uniref:Energy-coupling factor transporter ATP-binding protein EcfA2 n=2 Tax=Mycoplasmopsis californica TaxID=2113 RepID=A0A059XLM8_9BACT|nr:energy-coupling factor transporter ATPase [Mycoplasmopsis californica]AIA29439.1 cobalt ABC transporter ATP-binding protein [Mycoplasmopsis californica]BAP01112.1 cobalt import ATP-binding protein [Mycoplasmopsis californica HAZ160_1]BBG40978.1 cobalt import ATP-binding protein [Mycoplasmopsis californica]BBG41571.1 cobalt import ATP-binding protein [Mycoplasmopsis californica]BBG42165.1 cobalt import ATP-binding protein [Mycoplasmopsis californica]